MPNPTFRAAADANMKLSCSVPRCTENRYQISKYCLKHKARADTHGHPLAPEVYRKYWRQEEEAVRELFSLNPDHQGIEHGVNILRNWMRAAKERPYAVPAVEYLQRLYDSGADPKKMLIMIAGLWLYAERNWGRKILSDAQVDMLTGNHVCRFLPVRNMKTLPFKHKKEAGKYVREHIGPLLVNIVRSIVQKEREEDSAVSMMNSRLNMEGPLPWESDAS